MYIKSIIILLIIVNISWGENDFYEKVMIEDKYCPDNPDTLYNRHNVLQLFGKILKGQTGSVSDPYLIFERYNVINDVPNYFYVFDLTDTSNYCNLLNPLNKYLKKLNTTLYNADKDCIDLLNYHVYHFSSTETTNTYNNICILEDGTLTFFKAINCIERGHRLEDVLTYLKDKNIVNKKETIERLKLYKYYPECGLSGEIEFPSCKEYPEVSTWDKYERIRLQILEEEKEKQEKEKKGKN